MRILCFLLVFLAACTPPETKSPGVFKTDTVAREPEDNSIEPKPVATEPSAIEGIRAEYNRINRLQLVSRPYEFVCDEKTKVTVSAEGTSLVKVSIDWGWVGDASTKEEFYYQNGRLIFRYVRTEGGVGNEPTTVHETRTYVKDDRVIRFLKDGGEKPCSDCRVDSSSKEYRVLAAASNETMKTALCR